MEALNHGLGVDRHTENQYSNYKYSPKNAPPRAELPPQILHPSLGATQVQTNPYGNTAVNTAVAMTWIYEV